MTNTRMSDFITVNELEDSTYVDAFTTSENVKIAFSDLKNQLEDEIVGTFIYPTINALVSADLEADVDNPTYVRCEETEYRLYKITSVAASGDDIALNNGNTATFQEEYSKSGFVTGAGTVTDGAMVLFSGTSGTSIEEGAVPTDVGNNIIEATSAGADSYLKVLADDSVSLRTIGQVQSDLNLPGDTESELALKAPLSSPVFTDNPRAPTPSATDNDTSIATTAFVQTAVSDKVKTIPTFADLATTTADVDQVVYLKEYNSGTGLGGGELLAKAGSITPDNVITFASATAGVYFQRINYSVVDAVMAGIIGDDTANDTAALVAAMAAAAGGTFYLNKPCRMTTVGLTVPSNTTVIFGESGSISLLAHNTDTYQMLRVHDVGNVRIVNPVLDGRKDLNSAVSGEFGMGISLRGTTGKVIIDNPITTNCWGDGLYIGATATQDWCDDVVINNPTSTGNRRQGLSLISAKSFVCNGGSLGDITGTLPSAGIDIEPNAATNRLDYIRFNNVKTFTNVFGGAPGVLIYLGAFGTGSGNTIDIEFNNCKDKGSTLGFVVRNTTAGLKGRIVFNECVSQDALFGGFGAYDTSATGPRVEWNSPVVVDNNRGASSSVNLSAPFNVQREASSVLVYAIGNVHIKNPTLILNSGTTASLLHAKDLAAGSALLNCTLEDTREIVGSGASRRVLVGSGSTFNFSDRYNQLYRSITIGYTPDPTDNFTVRIVHERTSGNSGFTLASTSFIGNTQLIIENTNNGQFTVAPPSGGNFIGQAVGIGARCDASPGHVIVIEKVTSLIYRIVSLQGSFTYV